MSKQQEENFYNDKIYHGLTIYYARIIPSVDIYEVKDLYVRTVGEDYFVATDKKDKRAFLFMYSELNNGNIFLNRNDAVKKVKEMEGYKK